MNNLRRDSFLHSPAFGILEFNDPEAVVRVSVLRCFRVPCCLVLSVYFPRVLPAFCPRCGSEDFQLDYQYGTF